MSERAHPDDPGFKDRYIFELKHGFLPWIKKWENPWKKAFMWRYQWVNYYCKDKDVLDIPCGMGWGTSFIKKAKSVVGMDINNMAIQEANQRYSNSRVKFFTGDMSSLCVKSNSVDVVSCLEGIEHVPVETGCLFINECYRVLKSDGMLLISSPYCKTKKHSGNPFHVYEYRPEEIVGLLSRYFVVGDILYKEVDIMSVMYIVCKKKDMI